MPHVTSPFRHLKTYPTDGPLRGEDLADHKLAPGAVPDGYVAMANNAAPNEWDWSNDGATWVNVPLYACLISDSAEIVATTTAPQTFNKALSLGAGAANVQGTIIRIRAAGKYSSRAVSPGTISWWIFLGASVVGFSYADMPVSSTDQGWSIEVDVAVRAIGTSGVVRPGFGFGGAYGVWPGAAATEQSVRATSASANITMNLMLAMAVQVQVQFSTIDPANKATMTHLTYELPKAGVVVS